MMLRPVCVDCNAKATVEMNGVTFCSIHALERVRKANEIPDRLRKLG